MTKSLLSDKVDNDIVTFGRAQESSFRTKITLFDHENTTKENVVPRALRTTREAKSCAALYTLDSFDTLVDRPSWKYRIFV